MSVVYISDLHLKKNSNLRDLDGFIEYIDRSKPEIVVFGGDIFDFQVGNHQEFITDYSHIYEFLEITFSKVNRAIFIEGNHDFHLQEIFKSRFKKFEEKIEYKNESFIYELDGKKILITHGHEVDYYNLAYKRWRKTYKSSYFRFFINKVLPYYMINKLGNWASMNSKKRGRVTFDYDKKKKEYRDGAEALSKDHNVSIIIAGHTHIKDYYVCQNKTLYINCGFPLRDRCFIEINKDNAKFIEL